MRVTTMPDGAMADVLANLDARDYLTEAGVSPEDLDTLVLRLRP
jgi:hypothetical protein